MNATVTLWDVQQRAGQAPALVSVEAQVRPKTYAPVRSAPGWPMSIKHEHAFLTPEEALDAYERMHRRKLDRAVTMVEAHHDALARALELREQLANFGRRQV